MGLWDYTLFEIGITEIMFQIGIMGFQSIVNWDFQSWLRKSFKIGITGLCLIFKCKLHAPFEIGITG